MIETVVLSSAIGGAVDTGDRDAIAEEVVQSRQAAGLRRDVALRLDQPWS